MSSSDEDLVSGSASSDDELQRKKSKSKKSKHRKHSKSHKKEKKSKKKSHKRRRRSSDSESSSGSEGEEWVAKDDFEPAKPVVMETAELDKRPSEAAEDEEWAGFGQFLPTYSNAGKKAKRQEEKEAKRQEKAIDTLGKHERELNPYWKDGGTGLPSEDPDTVPKSTSVNTMVGDGGLSWLRKAFIRAKEQAQQEGRSLEDIAEERWGSLQKFYEMLEEAEERAKEKSRSERDKDRYGDDPRHNDRHGESSHRRDHRHDDSRRRGRQDNDSFRRDRYNDSPQRSDRRREKFQKPRYDSGSDEDRSTRHPKSDERHKSSHRTSRAHSPTRSSGSGWRKHKPETTAQEDSKLVESERIPPIRQPVKEKSPDLPEPDEAPPEEVKVLTDKEMNELSAKILKAEMLGNEDLAKSLKEKREKAEQERKDYVHTGKSKSIKTVIKVVLEDKGAGPRRKVKEKAGDTHKDGQRVRYFPDDDRQTLKNMFEAEKRNTVENENALFSRLAGKGMKATEDYDMDDIFTDRASSSKTEMKEKEREIREILDEDKSYKKTLENCNWCFDGNKLPKNLVIATGEKSFLCLPPYQSLTEGHCLIVPMYHTVSATELDEDVWEEMQKFRKAIVDMFSQSDEDVVIFESALFLKKHPHMYLECVPMPKETGELAPIYFKKAIQECETEWSQNKKVVELRNRDVRKAVPKGLPYFAVDFGMDSGFAHVVEDERYFPRNFAQEIIGGMMELDHHLWRKQKQDDFKTQRSKVMNFLKSWGPFDWTRECEEV